MISVVTSCSAAGWQEYGRRFVETYKRFWPAGVRLYVVSEDDILDQVTTFDGVSFINLIHFSAPADRFLERHAKNEVAHGRRGGRYNYLFDAFKFSKKVFAIDLVARIVRGRLFWVDADVVTFAPVPDELFLKILPDAFALCGLARRNVYTECGFVGYNLEHSEGRPFIEAFAKLYATDKIFDLVEWHDSFAFDWLRSHRVTPMFPIDHGNRPWHPFINSVLGRYMDHLKGPRKLQGRSPETEQQSENRAAPYWGGRC